MFRRVRIYLFGVVLGSVFVYMFLIKGRESELFGWLPSKRIKYDIEQLETDTSSFSKCIINCYGITNIELKKSIKEGDFDFSKSVTDSVPRLYKLKAPFRKGNIELTYLLWLEKAELNEIHLSEIEKLECKCE